MGKSRVGVSEAVIEGLALAGVHEAKNLGSVEVGSLRCKRKGWGKDFWRGAPFKKNAPGSRWGEPKRTRELVTADFIVTMTDLIFTHRRAKC